MVRNIGDWKCHTSGYVDLFNPDTHLTLFFFPDSLFDVEQIIQLSIRRYFLDPAGPGRTHIQKRNKVHCVGGQSGATNPTFQSDHNTLDLSRNYVDLNTLNQGWSTAAPLPEANSEFVLAKSGTSNFFINGGTGLLNGKPLLHQSIVYSSATNTWDTTIATANATDTLVQARGAVGTVDVSSLSKQDRVYIWGGVEDATIGHANTSYSGTFLVMNPLTGTWNPSVADGTDTLAWTPRIGHAAHHNLGIISIMGGQQAFYDTTSNTYALFSVSLTDIPQFNTILLRWVNANVSGDIPSSRSYHTVTPLGLSTAILYGGVTPGTNQPVTDVLYTAQVGTGSVSFVRSTVSGSGPGPRYGHSAVLYGSNTVLILGGVDTTGTAKNDVNVYHHLRKAWQTSFSTTETYFSTSVGSPASGTASRTAPTPTSCVNCGSARQPLTFGEQEGIAAGVSTGGLVLFALIGALLGMSIARHKRAAAAAAAANIDQMTHLKMEITSDPNRPLPPFPGQ